VSQVDTRIVGVDCATEPRKVGLALADLRAGTLVVKNSRCASKDSRPSAIVAEWLRTSDRALIALDAPLGWPAALSEALRRHSAGAPVAVTADQMFRRLTDDEIYRRLSKRPMDVGADRIARTARAALQLLDELTLAIGSGLELVWSPDFRTRIGAIEVYPAATRISLGVAAGSGSLRGLTSRVKFDRGAPPRSKDARDAIVCALAGAEFLLGRAVPPTSSQEPLARREGWIWAGGLPHPTSARKTDRGKTLVRPREPSAASDARTVAKALSAPRRLWEPEELLQNPCPIPCESGLYGWYFRNLPSVPVSGHS
jgi:predicted nuclease with RNAse H fold